MLDILNIEPYVITRDLKGYVIEIYGDPKVGKTTLATRFPKSLLGAAEKGYTALPGVRPAPINSWTDFLNLLRQLDSDVAKEMYDNVILDTIDILYDYCEQYICMCAGTDDIADQKKLGFGKGYAKTEREFDTQLRKIVQMGYGLILISHSEEKTTKDAKGVETTKIGPTVNKRATKVVNRMADIIMYIRPHSHTDPVSGQEVTETYGYLRGTSRFVAGSRFKYLPDYLLLPREPRNAAYDVLVEALHNAIEKEAEGEGGQFVKDERNNLYVEQSSSKTFKQVIEEFTTLVDQILAKGSDPIEVTSRVENVLGKGCRVAEAQPDQQPLVEYINEELQSYLATL